MRLEPEPLEPLAVPDLRRSGSLVVASFLRAASLVFAGIETSSSGLLD